MPTPASHLPFRNVSTQPWRSLAVMAGLWLLLFLAGYPMPFVDDLYFIGAGVNMSRGGAFMNPWCPGLAFLGARDHFFAYMPLHSYVLAGYLTITGVSRAALAFFQVSMGFMATVGLHSILLRGREDLPATLALGVVTVIFLGNTGLRPDALGLALFTCGLALLLSTSLASWTFGSLCLALSFFTSPNLAVLLPVAWAGGFLYLAGTSFFDWRGSAGRLALALTAGIAAFLIFSALIDFQFRLFFTIFNAARRMAYSALSSDIVGAGHSRHHLIRLLVHFGLPLLVTAAAGVAFTLRRGRSRAALGLLLLMQLLLFITAFSSGTGVLMLTYASMLTALVLATNLPTPTRLVGGMTWTALCFFFLITIGYKTVVLLTFPAHPSPSHREALLAKVARQHPPAVYVDEYAADTIYNYRLPPQTFDCHFGRLGGTWNGDAPVEAFPSGSALVVSPETLDLMDDTHRPPQFATIPFYGAIYPHVTREPFQLLVVPVPAH